MKGAVFNSIAVILVIAGKTLVSRLAKVGSAACITVWCLTFAAAAQNLQDIQRFRYSGDGWLSLNSEKNSHSFSGWYRTGRGQYDEAALRAIGRVFDAAPAESAGIVSLRLIEYLDYIQDQLKPGGRITIISGFRAPEYNTALRNRGRLAAKASLHQYGMAADVKISGVPARELWNFVKAQKFGGAGYYQGASVHVDVGPARSWDETNSGVGSGISDDNKLIGLISNFDAYLPGEAVILRYIRMTAFPIGIRSRLTLEDAETNIVLPGLFDFDASPGKSPAAEDCHEYANIEDMTGMSRRLSPNIPSGTYRIRTYFCGDSWPQMPSEIVTPAFVVVGPP